MKPPAGTNTKICEAVPLARETCTLKWSNTHGLTMITNPQEFGDVLVRSSRRLRRILLAVGLAGVLAFTPTAGLVARINPDFEDAQHAEIGASAAQLLVQGNLAEYERQADALRQSRELTPAGFWKLALFYDGSARIAPNHPHDPAWAQVEASTGAYLAANPRSSSALIAAVRVLNAHAVELREGRADDAEDARAAAALTERARQLLETYRASGTRDPDWYASRIIVSLDQRSSKAEVIALAKEALHREPTYEPLLFAASEALRPDHGGSRAASSAVCDVGACRVPRAARFAALRPHHVQPRSSRNRPHRSAGDGGCRLGRSSKPSMAEITNAFPDPWNANAERSMACLLGTEAEYREAAARVPRPTFSVAWYDPDVGWGQCNTRQQEAREPAPAEQKPDSRQLLQGFSSPAFLATVLAAVFAGLGLLALVHNRSIANDNTDRRFNPKPREPYRPSIGWRAGQVVLGLLLGIVGIAGVGGFGLLVGSDSSALALPVGLGGRSSVRWLPSAAQW